MSQSTPSKCRVQKRKNYKNFKELKREKIVTKTKSGKINYFMPINRSRFKNHGWFGIVSEKNVCDFIKTRER